MNINRKELIKKFKELGIDISKACEIKITPFKITVFSHKKDKNGKYIKTNNNNIKKEKEIYKVN